MKKQKTYTVQSVKRLSDGVVFSVGDKIGINGTSPVIFKIELELDYCWLHYMSIADNKEVPGQSYAKTGSRNYTSEINDAIKR